MTEINLQEKDVQDSGNDMYDLVKELFPICRSITGDGVRQTLEIIRKQIPLKIHEIPSGTKVFDWKVEGFHGKLTEKLAEKLTGLSWKKLEIP